VVECLPSKKALSSNPNTAKINNKKKERNMYIVSSSAGGVAQAVKAPA
jgi:hypothetical protein